MAKSKKLEKLLKDAPLPVDVEQEGRLVNDDLIKKIRKTLVEFYPDRTGIENYDPVVAMALMANEVTCDEKLAATLHKEIASYMYPKVRSFEIKQKSDTTLNVNIKIAEYARVSKKDDVVEVEDIILEGDDFDEDKPPSDMSDYFAKGSKVLN